MQDASTLTPDKLFTGTNNFTIFGKEVINCGLDDHLPFSTVSSYLDFFSSKLLRNGYRIETWTSLTPAFASTRLI